MIAVLSAEAPEPAQRRALLRALGRLTGQVMTLSPREYWCDITHSQMGHGTPEHMARGLFAQLAQLGLGELTLGLSVHGPWAAHVARHGLPGRVNILPPAGGSKPPVWRDPAVAGAGVFRDSSLWWPLAGPAGRAPASPVTPPGPLLVHVVIPPRTTGRRAVVGHLKRTCAWVVRRLRSREEYRYTLAFTLRGSSPGRALALRAAFQPRAGGSRELLAALLQRLDQCWSGETVTAIEVGVAERSHRWGQLELF